MIAFEKKQILHENISELGKGLAMTWSLSELCY